MTDRPSSSAGSQLSTQTDLTLLDLLDRVIDHGVVLTGNVTISVADVDLIYLELRLLLASVERARSLIQAGEERSPQDGFSV